MSALDAFRVELRACLGPDVFLKRDRDMRALFVCGKAPEALEGYEIWREGPLFRVDLAPDRQRAFIQSLSPGPRPRDPRWAHLCRCLLTAEPAPEQPWPPIRQTLLLLDAGEYERLLPLLTADLALRKRAHAPLPAACAYLIQQHFAKEESPC